MLKETPYWWRDAPLIERDIEPVQSNCDVAIVGAGYTGLSAAIHLARAGKSVQVFDRGVAGAGASTLNGGILSGNLRLGLKASMAAFGSQRGLAMYREGIAARHAVRDFIKAEQIECDLRYNGRFTGAMNAKDFEQMKRAAEFETQTLGVGADIIERSQQSSMIDSDLYHGGIGRKDIGSIHPAKFFRGLLRVALDAGVVVHDNTGVTGIFDRFRLQTQRGTVRCEHVIVATNAYGDASNGWLRRRIVPVTSRIIATDEIPATTIQRLMPGLGTFGEARYLGRYYRPSPDGKRILLGGRDVLLGRNPEGAAKRLAGAVASIFPELRGIGVQSHWAGRVAFTRDQLPSLFEHEGIIYVGGYCGSGTAWAPWLGGKAAFRILGDDRAQTAFECDPPNSVPLYSGRPWFMPFAIGWYGARDWIKGR